MKNSVTSIFLNSILTISLVLCSVSANIEDDFASIDYAFNRLGTETTSAPAPAPVVPGGNKRSMIILSYSMLTSATIVFTFFFWTLRSQIYDLMVKVCLQFEFEFAFAFVFKSIDLLYDCL